MRLSYSVFELWQIICQKSPILTYPPACCIGAHFGVTPFKFRRYFWRQKTRVPGLSYGVVYVILFHFDILPGVTDGRMDGRADRHTTTAYTARRASIASRSKSQRSFPPKSKTSDAVEDRVTWHPSISRFTAVSLEFARLGSTWLCIST